MSSPKIILDTKVAEWLSTINKEEDKRKTTTIHSGCELSSHIVRRAKKARPERDRERERERRRSPSTSSSEGARVDAARARGERLQRLQRRRQRRRALQWPRADPALDEDQRDPRRLLRELRRLSDEEEEEREDVSSPYCSRSPSSPERARCRTGTRERGGPSQISTQTLSRVPSSNQTRPDGGDDDEIVPAPLARLLLRREEIVDLDGRVTPSTFCPARHLSRSALRRIYRLPNDREERRRRFKEELRRRCGLKVWSWEELSGDAPATLSTFCPVEPASEEEQLRFRYRTYSARKMGEVIALVRSALRAQDKLIDAKFVELELETMPDDDDDGGGGGGSEKLGTFTILLERERLMELRNRQNQARIDFICQSEHSFALNKEDAHSLRSNTPSRQEKVKAFERDILMKLEWLQSEDEQDFKFRNINTRQSIFHPHIKLLSNDKRIIVDKKVTFGKHTVCMDDRLDKDVIGKRRTVQKDEEKSNYTKSSCLKKSMSSVQPKVVSGSNKTTTTQKKKVEIKLEPKTSTKQKYSKPGTTRAFQTQCSPPPPRKGEPCRPRSLPPLQRKLYYEQRARLMAGGAGGAGANTSACPRAPVRGGAYGEPAPAPAPRKLPLPPLREERRIFTRSLQKALASTAQLKRRTPADVPRKIPFAF